MQSGFGDLSGGSVPSGFEIPGVGHFLLSTSKSGDFRYFTCDYPRGDGGVVRILVYPEEGPFDDAYCQRVRETTLYIVGNTVDLLAPTKGDIAEMLDLREIPEPTSYDGLFRGLKLSYVKFLADNRTEIIFEECPETGWLNLNIYLDEFLRIQLVQFDG
ncbi:MAG: hypothetical protein ACK5S5_17095 [Planctomycetota bacterium]|jgi:hypothetical protein